MNASHSVFLFTFEAPALFRPSLKGLLLLVLALSLNLFISSVSFAGAGDLDPTFGNEGIVVTDFGSVSEEDTQDAVIQDDGKLIVASHQFATHLRYTFALARIDPDGSLDDYFGTNGKVVTSLVDENEFNLYGLLSSIALQVDKKIIAGGIARNVYASSDHFALVRYHPDGNLDTSFGNGGTVISDIGTPTCRHSMNDILIQEDGRIIAAGLALLQGEDGHCSYGGFAVTRYNPDGSLDQTFGIDGKVISEFDGESGEVKKLILQPDGKIIAIGGGYFSLLLARYNPDGSLDTGFGEGGKIIRDCVGYKCFAEVNSGLLQSDGKIIVAGRMGYWDDVLVRFNTDGTIDNSFGIDGFAAAPTIDAISATFDARDVTVYGDGKLLVASETYKWTEIDGRAVRTGPYFCLYRFYSDGTIDTSFGNSGEVLTSFNHSYGNAGWAKKVLQRDNGKIVAAGYSSINWRSDPEHIADLAEEYRMLNRYENYMVVAQYEENGALDPSFSDDGRMALSMGASSDDWANNVIATQGDGKILVSGGVSGVASRRLTKDFALVRYNSDGSIDETFGEGGKVQTDFWLYRGDPALDQYRSYEQINAIAIYNDGKIVAVGQATADTPTVWQPSAFALARYHSNGSLDHSFGTDGRVVTEIGGVRPYGAAFDVVIQPDQKIVVVGYAEVVIPAGKPPPKMFMTRYNYDGSLDSTFGDGGIVVTDFDPDHVEYANAVVLQPDGKILVCGGTDDYFNLENTDFAVVRYNEDGSLDQSFGTGGKVRTDFGNFDYANSILLQSDGRIVVTGISIRVNAMAAMARYLPDGTLDDSFGNNNGKVITQFGDPSVYLYSMTHDSVLQEDGKILLSGYTGRWPPDSEPGFSTFYEDFALARYNTDGSPDYTFGVGGIVHTNIGTVTIDGVDYDTPIDNAYALTLQSDGKIIVVGKTFTFVAKQPSTSGEYLMYYHEDMVLVRYEGVTNKVDQLDGLVYRVQTLAADGVLNNGQANSLQAKLRAAIQQVDRWNIKTAINQLDGFMNEVSALTNEQILSPQQGEELYEVALVVRSFLAN